MIIQFFFLTKHWKRILLKCVRFFFLSVAYFKQISVLIQRKHYESGLWKVMYIQKLFRLWNKKEQDVVLDGIKVLLKYLLWKKNLWKKDSHVKTCRCSVENSLKLTQGKNFLTLLMPSVPILLIEISISLS